ncbi:uncharacterized protein [Erythrolamprus reginae]|uniref:uncharacterized protein isoform X2 n=1 Tax=Erythrolamprus reginae TaxID=121349 RepID=UPI00396C802B
MESSAAPRMDLGGPFSILLAMAASCLLFRHLTAKRRLAGLPPGPAPLPFLGNMHQVDVKELIPSLKELSKTYGPMYTFHLGSRPCLVLSGYQVLKEALIDKAEEFSGRGDFPAVQMWSKGNGIVYGTGQRWRELRRFAIGTLKNFGMGKRSMEQRVKEEAQFLVAEFRKTQALRPHLLPKLRRVQHHQLPRLRTALRVHGQSLPHPAGLDQQQLEAHELHLGTAALRLPQHHAVGAGPPPENLRQLPEAGQVCGRAAGDEQADPGPQLPQGLHRLLPHQDPAGIALAPARPCHEGEGPRTPWRRPCAGSCCSSVWGLAHRAVGATLALLGPCLGGEAGRAFASWGAQLEKPIAVGSASQASKQDPQPQFPDGRTKGGWSVPPCRKRATPTPTSTRTPCPRPPSTSSLPAPRRSAPPCATGCASSSGTPRWKRSCTKRSTGSLGATAPPAWTTGVRCPTRTRSSTRSSATPTSSPWGCPTHLQGTPSSGGTVSPRASTSSPCSAPPSLTPRSSRTPRPSTPPTSWTRGAASGRGRPSWLSRQASGCAWAKGWPTWSSSSSSPPSCRTSA